MKGNQFNPAVPFNWTRSMIAGVEKQRERSNPTVMCLILAINCAYRINKSEIEIPLTHKLLQDFCIERHSSYRILTLLEKAALIRIHKQKGRAITIDLLLIPSSTTKVENNR